MREQRISNRKRYNALAASYSSLIRVASLGRFDRFYRAVAHEVDALPGGTILDLGCGPATLTPDLRDKVGATGSVIGIDIADEMIARARQIATRCGWQNVRFERSDALHYAPSSPVDAAVFSLSLTTMSDPGSCLEHVVSMLRPGGQLVIFDSIPESSRRLAGMFIHLKAPLVGAIPTGVPLEFARTNLDRVRVRRFLGGVYSLISARKPPGPMGLRRAHPG
jgi:ubiquinone/menaquinone biosynthesis C-methylase UbiE